MFPERMGPTTRSSMRGSCIRSPKKYVTRSSLEDSSSSFLFSPKKTVVFQDESQQDVEMKAKPARKTKKVSISSNSDEGLGDLSFGPCSSLLPDIPPALARPTHNLKQAWTLWYFRADRSLSWEENQQAVATVTTVEEFWQLHQLLLPASQMASGCDLAMFRAGVLPDWEDPANLPGGRWIVRRERPQLDEAWLELLFYLLGEHSGHSLAREVNGVVVSARKKGDKVAVWLGDARHLAAVVDVGREVRARLGLEAQDRVMFSVHREDRERDRSQAPILL